MQTSNNRVFDLRFDQPTLFFILFIPLAMREVHCHIRFFTLWHIMVSGEVVKAPRSDPVIDVSTSNLLIWWFHNFSNRPIISEGSAASIDRILRSIDQNQHPCDNDQQRVVITKYDGGAAGFQILLRCCQLSISSTTFATP